MALEVFIASGLLLLGAITSRTFIDLQRKTYSAIRRRWLSHVFDLDAIDELAFEHGWRTQARLSLFMYITTAVYELLEGKVIQSIVMFLVVLSVILLSDHPSMTRTTFKFIPRLFVMYHVFEVLYLSEAQVKSDVIRTSPRLCLTSIMAFESLPETFFGTAAYSYAIWTKCAKFALPLQMFIFVTIPFHISGVREIACLHSVPKFFKKLDAISICSLPICMVALLFAYHEVPSEDAPPSTAAFQMVGFLHMLLFLGCVKYGKTLDTALTPIFCAMLEETGDVLNLERANTLVCQILISSAIGIHLLATYQVFGQDFINTNNFDMDKIAVCGVTSMGIILSSFSYARSKDPMQRRYAAFSSHLSALLFTLWCLPRCHAHVIVLTTCRFLLSIEKRRFSLLQKHNAICGAVSLLLIEDHYVGRVVMFIAITTFTLGTIGCVSREIVARILEQEKDLQAFMHHQMKQKFSSVGSALEQLLEFLSSNPSLAEDVLPHSQQLLRKALRECRRGGDACSIVNTCQALSNGEFKPTLTSKYPHLILKEWYENGSIDVQDLQFVGACPFELVLDWDLLQLVLNTWIRDADALTVEWTIVNPNPPKLAMTFRLSSPRQLGFTNSIIAQALDGRFSENRQEFTLMTRTSIPTGLADLSCINKSVSDTSPASTKGSLTSGTTSAELSSTLELIQETFELPKNMVYAVLDDNALTRRTMERIIGQQLNGSESSFTRGSAVVDCHKFPQEIIDMRVDIAIFDESLDYDTEEHTTSGTSLAVKARQMGFKGCAILHSAHAHLSKTRPDVFDGFIIKSASRKAFLNGVKNAWIKHKSRTYGDISTGYSKKLQ